MLRLLDGIWKRVLRTPLKVRFAAAVGLEVDASGQWVAFWVGRMTSVSSMPDGLEKRFTENEFIDLIAFQMSQR